MRWEFSACCACAVKLVPFKILENCDMTTFILIKNIARDHSGNVF